MKRWGHFKTLGRFDYNEMTTILTRCGCLVDFTCFWWRFRVLIELTELWLWSISFSFKRCLEWPLARRIVGHLKYTRDWEIQYFRTKAPLNTSIKHTKPQAKQREIYQAATSSKYCSHFIVVKSPECLKWPLQRFMIIVHKCVLIFCLFWSYPFNNQGRS